MNEPAAPVPSPQEVRESKVGDWLRSMPMGHVQYPSPVPPTARPVSPKDELE